MKGIQHTLFLFSLALIGVLIIPFFVFISIHFRVVNEYKKNTDRIILEQNIPQYSERMILDYYYYVVDIRDLDKKDAYMKSVAQLKEIFRILDKKIVQEDTVLKYTGIKNMVVNIIRDLDEGIRKATGGDILNNSMIYETANRNEAYVKELTGELVLAETRNIEQLQKVFQRYYYIGLFFVLVLFTVVIVGSIVYSKKFSIRVASPINELSAVSQKIAQGDMDLEINPALLSKQDETGTLAISFQSMVTNLKNKIKQLEESKEKINSTNEMILKKNEELERFNKLTTGRELKMIELKNKLHELEEAMKQMDSSNTPTS